MSHATDIIKLAPTLSAKERFRMVVTDMQKVLEGGQRTLSETERQAIIQCENRPMWEDYTRRIGIMQWADAFWTKDIEMEKLRVFACSLLLSRAVDRFFEDSFISMPEKIQEISCAGIRKDVEMFERCAQKFYAYRDAIIVIERELYGMPLFHERKQEAIASFYEAVDDMFENYNHRIQMLCESKGAKKRLKLIAENPESYTAKKPVPSQDLIDGLVKEIMDIVDSEMEMLGR